MVRISLILATLLSVLQLQEAAAADLGPEPPPALPQSESMNFFGSGWYIRGDLGYSVWQGPSATYNGVPFDHLSVSNNAVIGAGIGYKLNNWVRGDVTADYTFSGNIQSLYTIANCCTFTDRTRVGGWAVLANGYVDLGTWYGVTPYVGGGVGYGFTQISKTVNQEFLPTGTGTLVPVTDPNTGLPVFHGFAAHTTGGFAWALEAGAAVDVAPSVKLDLNYRYLNIADARFPTDTLGVAPKLRSLGQHQFRIGLRYMFDE
jgi:opacity protein-like surface antigen